MRWWPWGRKRARVEQTTAPAGNEPTFTMIDGRRFLVGDSYILPRDLTEANRIDFQHFLLRSALGGNFAAPLERPSSILDVACGNGRWAMEMAELFPAANVVGLDITVPPVEAGGDAAPRSRPDNYVFVQGDVLQRLPFADVSFDFVHERLLYGSMPAAKWPWIFGELARVTRPGGWVESVESTLLIGDGPAVRQFNDWALETTARRGTDVLLSRHLDQFLRDAGLQRTRQRQRLGRDGGGLER